MRSASTAVLVVTAIVLGGAATADAAVGSHAPPALAQVCVLPRTHLITAVTQGGHCPAHTSRETIGTPGPPGATGAVGATGATGAIGPAGPAGSPAPTTRLGTTPTTAYADLPAGGTASVDADCTTTTLSGGVTILTADHSSLSAGPPPGVTIYSSRPVVVGIAAPVGQPGGGLTALGWTGSAQNTSSTDLTIEVTALCARQS